MKLIDMLSIHMNSLFISSVIFVSSFFTILPGHWLWSSLPHLVETGSDQKWTASQWTHQFKMSTFIVVLLSVCMHKTLY